jgi:hypothetical protein
MYELSTKRRFVSVLQLLHELLNYELMLKKFTEIKSVPNSIILCLIINYILIINILVCCDVRFQAII